LNPRIPARPGNATLERTWSVHIRYIMHLSTSRLEVPSRLEFVTALGCLLMSVVVYIPSGFNDSTWIRYTAFLRLLRVFRLGKVLQLPSMLRFLYIFVSVEHIRVFYQTFLSMLPAATRLLKVCHSQSVASSCPGCLESMSFLSVSSSSVSSRSLGDSQLQVCRHCSARRFRRQSMVRLGIQSSVLCMLPWDSALVHLG
jgi:hypothetical protein